MNQFARLPDPETRAAHDRATTPRFGAFANQYARFRPQYPEIIFSRLAMLVSPMPETCIELGAGSGQATRSLLAQFHNVIAVEPDAEMAALIPPSPRLQVRVEPAEDVDFAAHSADCVASATAFHWMDAQLVCEKAAQWLKPNCPFYAFGYSSAQYPGAPQSLIDAVQKHSRLWRTHMHNALTGWRPYGELLALSGVFRTIESYEYYVDFNWTPDELAGFLLSTSYAQAFAAGVHDPEAYCKNVHADIGAAARGHDVHVRFPIEVAWAKI